MKRDTNRGGFTLIELLVVTVVVVTLMGVVFRLAGVGGTNRAKAETIQRLQRLENALSGYYAAYGSYPPVPLQGRSRSIYKKVDDRGLQEDGDKESGDTDLEQGKTMNQILAACRAQPVSVSWPPPDTASAEKMVSALRAAYNESGMSGPGNFTLLKGASLADEINWRGTGKNGKGVQLFEFGLLSFLFPRYLFMLEGKMDKWYDPETPGRGQWAANNQLPCRLDDGRPFADWKEVRNTLGAGGSGSQQARRDAWII
ncbi:MAG: prepilin-type N-terminal cleavage/methylation domain-containing protein, partial [bacterium]|nr:prepilin-type N-terminal cleavage/methylation domain-containing protein [bacterium]